MALDTSLKEADILAHELSEADKRSTAIGQHWGLSLISSDTSAPLSAEVLRVSRTPRCESIQREAEIRVAAAEAAKVKAVTQHKAEVAANKALVHEVPALTNIDTMLC